MGYKGWILAALFTLITACVPGARAEVVLTLSPPGVQASTVPGVKTETFEGFARGTYTTLNSTIGTYTSPGMAVFPAGAFGGAGGKGNYFVIGNVTGTKTATLTLKQDAGYVGFWYSAGDARNVVQLYENSTLVYTLDTADLVHFINLLPNSAKYFVNPNNGLDQGQPFAYVNFFGTNGTVFNKVVFNNVTTGTGFETDNHSVGPVSPITGISVVGWTTKTPLPQPRDGRPSVAAINGKIYVIGGNDGTAPVSTTNIYDVTTGVWTAGAPMPAARQNAAVAVVNGKIHVMGGAQPAGTPHTDHFVYDPVANTWATRAPLPAATTQASAVAIGNAIYFIGGNIIAGGNVSSTVANNLYDDLSNTWTTKAPMPTARAAFGMAVVEQSIYAIGGHDASAVLATNEVYDTVANTWSTKASMPTARNHAITAAMNGKISVIGGSPIPNPGSGATALAKNEEYDPQLDIWHARQPMPTPRYASGAAVVNNSIYVIGGDSGGAIATNEALTFQAPFNDNFSNAATLQGNAGQIAAVNLFATSEAGEPNHAGIKGGASLWYRWTAPVSENIVFTTSGSDFDTLLAVYTGATVSSLTAIASNDNYAQGTPGSSRVLFHAVAGTTYFIAVDGVTDAEGYVVLHWLPPVNNFDVEGQGQSDLLFQNQSNGQLLYWTLNGTSFLRYSFLTPVDPGAGWNVVGTADFNNDGKPDVLFQDKQTGKLAYWLLNGPQAKSIGLLGDPGSPDWKVVSLTDLDGDGKPDLLFQNQQTGSLVYWLMDGVTLRSIGTLTPANPGAGWKVVGTADFNGDDKIDLLFQNQQSGALVYWLMDGVNLVTAGYLSPANPGAGWNVVSLTDLNGDGKADVVFQNQQNGKLAYWLMDGIHEVSLGLLADPGTPAWKVVSAH